MVLNNLNLYSVDINKVVVSDDAFLALAVDCLCKVLNYCVETMDVFEPLIHGIGS